MGKKKLIPKKAELHAQRILDYPSCITIDKPCRMKCKDSYI